jgi:hypothetical protein
MPDAMIFDLDGTLIAPGQRPYVNPHNILGYRNMTLSEKNVLWDRYIAESIDDIPFFPVLHVCLSMLQHGHYKLFIVTSRPNHHRGVTSAWLYKNYLSSAELVMLTPEHGFKIDNTEYKRAELTNIRNRGFNPVFAVEDQPLLADMYRSEGVPCFLVGDHEPW